MGLADEIREQVRLSPWSLAELGRRAGINPGNMSRFSRGEAGVSLKALDRLFDVLGLRIVAPDHRRLKPEVLAALAADTGPDRLGRALVAAGTDPKAGRLRRIRRPPQVREHVLERLRAGDRVRDVAAELEIPPATISAWAAKARKAGEL